MTHLSLADIVHTFDLSPHPEGGYYREIYRDGTLEQGGTVTSIYFVLEAGKPSHWHRVLGATEVWCFHAGAPLVLKLSTDHPSRCVHTRVVLGADVLMGHRLQAIVAPNVWQTAESQGAWSLVSCIVAPAFSFDRFEMLSVSSDECL